MNIPFAGRKSSAVAAFLIPTFLLLGGMTFCSQVQSLLGRENDDELLSLPSPLEEVTFPDEAVQYPEGWPTELRLPEEFIPVEVGSGELPESNASALVGKFRFHGPPRSASEFIASHALERGWQTVEQSEVGENGFLMVIETDNAATGIILLDSDGASPNETIVQFTLFP